MKILEVTSDLDGGGVDRLLYDYCSRLIPELQFDFIVTSNFEGMLEKPLIDLGCNIFHVSPLRENYRLHTLQIKKILQEGNYDIVHVHSGYKAAIVLRLAKKAGVKGRIAHSHIAYIPERFHERIIRIVFTVLTKFYATDLFACGEDAAQWMWGGIKNVFIMTNAINIGKFEFDDKERTRLRTILNIDKKLVLGCVARFSKQKNHFFLVRVLKDLLKYKPEAMLLLVGRGELLQDIKLMVKQYGLDHNVIFLGVRNDVDKLLNAMDIFCLPSWFEGLPVSIVEAQANGIPICISNTITNEIKLNDNIYYLPIDQKGLIEWVEKIVELNGKRCKSKIKGTLYDIDMAVLVLKRKYFTILNKKNIGGNGV